MAAEGDIRRLRYRLCRQGMLELDQWLLPLERALSDGDGETVTAIETIVAADTPELVAMMQGEIPVPEKLRPWLERR